MIKNLNDIYEAGASLPEVTAEDNGDVLTVVEGAWAKAEAGGGVIIYEGTLSGNTFTLSNNKNAYDILNDIKAGKIVKIKDTTTTFYYDLIKYDGDRSFQFSCIVNLDKVYYRTLIFNYVSVQTKTGDYYNIALN